MLKLVNNSKYFKVVIEALSWCFEELNVEHSVVTSYPLDDNDNVYLICTTHELVPLPKKYISYNFEQLEVDDCQHNHTAFYDRLRRAELVLDYSEQNVNFLKSKNIDAMFVPLGYAPTMEKDNRRDDGSRYEYDFMFLGALAGRRVFWIHEISLIYYKYLRKLYLSDNCWDSKYDNIVQRTKASFNIHYYEGKTILEVHRIIPLIANKVLVYSERSGDSYYDRKYALLVNYIKKETLTHAMHSLRQLNDCDVEMIAEQRYEFLKRECKYIDNVRDLATYITYNL